MADSYRRKREAGIGAGDISCAVIDIGSNTVRMVIYGGAARAPTVLVNEKVTARLGRGLDRAAGGEGGKTQAGSRKPARGSMSDEAMELALAGLARFALILADLDVKDVEVVATAAVRDAANGPEFLDRVRELGLSPRLLSGEEEARISATGVIGAFPGAEGVVADLGGGSLELVSVGKGRAGKGVSLPLGSLRLSALLGEGEETIGKAIDDALEQAGWDHAVGGPIYMVGGTWRAMAVYAMHERSHPLSDPHGLRLSGPNASRIARRIARSTPEQLKAVPRISSMRSSNMPGAGALLGALIDRLQPSELVFSSWGLREGLLFDRLDPSVRDQDPLLAGIRQFASQHGTSPLVAARVAGWTLGALRPHGNGADRRVGDERIRIAATMLSLAAMQIEPNLRIGHAMEWALYKRWLGIDDCGRALLAAAITANGGRTDLPPLLNELAPVELLDEAIAWGLAIRLCRRLGAQSRKSLNVSALMVEDGELRLLLRESHAALYGQPTRKDLKALAERLGLTPRLIVLEKAEFTRIRDEAADRQWSLESAGK